MNLFQRPVPTPGSSPGKPWIKTEGMLFGIMLYARVVAPPGAVSDIIDIVFHLRRSTVGRTHP